MFVKFKWVEMSNFLSMGAAIQRVPLDNMSTNVIIGDNLDNGKEGMSKNGVGKTTILQALVFALYGDGFHDIRIDEFINVKNRKKLMVSVCFEINDEEYIVTRKRKPNSINVTKDGEPFTLSTTSSEDETIVELIGYDSDVFMNTTMLTNNVSNFIYQKRAPQKAFIEKMFNLVLLNSRVASLKAENKNIATDITVESTTLNTQESSNRRLVEMINNLNNKSNSWQSDKDAKLRLVQNKLTEFSEINITQERELNHDLAALHLELGDVQQEITGLSVQIRSTVPKITKLNEELVILRDGKCPRCEQGWVSEPEILHTESSIDELERSLAKLKEPLTSALGKESDLKSNLAAFLQEYTGLTTIEELNRIESGIITLNQEVERLQGEVVNPYIEQIEELKENQVEVTDDNLKKLNVVGDHYNFMIKLLSDSKSFVRKGIINQYVPVINQYVNNYLSLLESPNTFTLNDDLTIDIGYMGRTISTGGLSAGEKIRMSFALSMAFRNFMSMTGNNSNCIFIDEILDSGTDASGYQCILDILNKLDMTIFIITHQEWIKNECDNVITVRKENGFSEIIWNEEDVKEDN